MMKYEDKKISFMYPDDFKLVRVKEKWGQYGLEKKLKKKKSIVVIMYFVDNKDVLAGIKRDICHCFVDDCDEGEYLGEVIFGDKKGIGLVVTLNDLDHNFIQKRYRYLFPSDVGGLYIEVIGEENFVIDTYKEILESIKVKE